MPFNWQCWEKKVKNFFSTVHILLYCRYNVVRCASLVSVLCISSLSTSQFWCHSQIFIVNERTKTDVLDKLQALKDQVDTSLNPVEKALVIDGGSLTFAVCSSTALVLYLGMWIDGRWHYLVLCRGLDGIVGPASQLLVQNTMGADMFWALP
jgi:hypothetical protein